MMRRILVLLGILGIASSAHAASNHFKVETGNAQSLDYVGGGGGTAHTIACNLGDVVIGFIGRSGDHIDLSFAKTRSPEED